jgi:hypothetical protein
MAKKTLGRAKYSAFRIGGATILIAVGEFAHVNDKADFEQLPFRIFPPMYGFYIIDPEIALPETKPFHYEEIIPFPKSAKTIRVLDADDLHDVVIKEIDIPDFEAALRLDESGANFCVFRLGKIPPLVAKCDASVPPGFDQVFGPATIAECRKFVKEHGGS